MPVILSNGYSRWGSQSSRVHLTESCSGIVDEWIAVSEDLKRAGEGSLWTCRVASAQEAACEPVWMTMGPLAPIMAVFYSKGLRSAGCQNSSLRTLPCPTAEFFSFAYTPLASLNVEMRPFFSIGLVCQTLYTELVAINYEDKLMNAFKIPVLLCSQHFNRWDQYDLVFNTKIRLSKLLLPI